MGDELETIIVGTVVDDSPFTSKEEAQAVLDEAMGLARRAEGLAVSAVDMLDMARRRQAWKVLEFDSWESCLAANLPKERRLPIVAQLRVEGRSSVEIASALGVSTPTVNRDVVQARREGLLADEPARIVGSDGRQRPTTRVEKGPKKVPRRAVLSASWRTAVIDIDRKLRSISSMREDNRYGHQLRELADLTRPDIQAAYNLLGAVLEDFQILDMEQNR